MNLQSQKPPSALRRRVTRFLFTAAVALIVLPFVLMHAVTVVFALHDRNMKPFASKVVTSSFGHTLRCYELRQSDAEWDIVFIHGTSATAAIFGEQFRRPFPRANLLAADRQGSGASGPDRRVPGPDDQANAIGALLAKGSARRTILIGHSYGAPVALVAALKFPEEVAGVVLIGGSIDPALEQPYAVQRAVNWPLVSWLVPCPLRQCNRELLTLRADLVNLQPQLPKLAVPVVMLRGGKDCQVPISNVPEYNHSIPWEHPATVEAAIRIVSDRVGQRPGR